MVVALDKHTYQARLPSAFTMYTTVDLITVTLDLRDPLLTITQFCALSKTVYRSAELMKYYHSMISVTV